LQLLEELHNFDNSGSKPINYKRLRALFQNAVQQLHRNNNSNLDFLQFVDTSSSESIVKELKIELQDKSFQKVVGIICQLLTFKTSSQLSDVQKDILVEAIIFTGKSYQFSQYFLPDKLFLKHNSLLQIKLDIVI
jgi:hypothetical protein